MNKQVLRLAIVVAMLAAGAPAISHHAFAAEYDIDKPATLKGKLTRTEWVNPHGWIHVDVKDPKGNVINWACEFGSPNALLRRGLRKTDFPIGGEVTVKGYLAKSGKPILAATTVRLPNGQDFYAGSNNADAPKQ
ncbi:MAG: DUF6152 family protein [Gammaproteobacteria bacterium]